MANLYVASTGSNTAPYDTWAKAATAPLTATAAAAAGDTIYQHAETFTISADTTYTLAAGVRWICTNDKANEPPQTLSTAGVIASSTNSVDMYIVSASAYVYGLTLRTGGTTAAIIGIGTNNHNSVICESCAFESGSTSSAAVIQIGQQSSTYSVTQLINCSVKFGNASQSISLGGCASFIGGSYPVSTGTKPNTLFKSIVTARAVSFVGADFSEMTSGSTTFSQAGAYTTVFTLSQCKLSADSTFNGSIAGVDGAEYFLYDCASGDTHYKLAHYSYLGSTTVSAIIYADDGAEYNSAGDRHSWVVSGNANSTPATPYKSPWFSRYNEATAAITPEIEVLRDGSASAYTDVQVWGEWLVKTAGGSPLATLYSDFGGLLSAGADQDAGVGLAGWTGESGSAWSGRLECPSVTPAEIGHISARVIVAGNYTVYVDPQIRDT